VKLCLSICVLLLAVACASAADPVQPGASQLRLATWNLYWLSAEPASGMVQRSEADYAHLRRYARQLDADVISLQEVDGEEAARRVFDPAIYAFHFTSDGKNRQKTGFAFKHSLRVKLQPDLVELAISRTRRGADILVYVGDRMIRLLAVHLKSGCFDDPMTSSKRACNVLNQQLPVLESWIDARAGEGVPFAVLGDFNRRFVEGDTFWPEIDDHDPAEADLTAVTRGQTSRCWNGRYPVYIDHIVLSRSAGLWLQPGSFHQLQYDQADSSRRKVLSDHCPVAVTLSPSLRDLAASR
jgi:endonuclease/exonuclease/phosphatase family metal-dependent hydrolase